MEGYPSFSSQPMLFLEKETGSGCNTVQSDIFVKNQNQCREALMSGMTDGDHKLLL